MTRTHIELRRRHIIELHIVVLFLVCRSLMRTWSALHMRWYLLPGTRAEPVRNLSMGRSFHEMRLVEILPKKIIRDAYTLQAYI